MALSFLGLNLLSEDGAKKGIDTKNRVFATQGKKGCSWTNDAGFMGQADASGGGQNYLSAHLPVFGGLGTELFVSNAPKQNLLAQDRTLLFVTTANQLG